MLGQTQMLLQVQILLAATAAAVLVLGVLSGYIKNRLAASEPVLCLGLGVVLGPAVTGLVDLPLSEDERSVLLREAARITIALSVMAAALRLPKGYVRERLRELATILTGGMLLMWLASSLLVYWLFSVPILVALLIGAILTPTDPVLAHSIVTGKVAKEHIPERLRHTLTTESGANDGLGILLVMLPLLLLQHLPGEAWHKWFVEVLLREVLLAVVAGAVAGWLTGRAVNWARAQSFAEETSVLTVSLALALTLLAVLAPLNSDGILGVFVAGLFFNQFADPQADVEDEHVEEASGRFFDLPIFVLFGLFLPWAGWAELGWAGIALVVGLLLLRRLPAWSALYPALPSLRDRRDLLFNGWFGPIGIAALFYANKAAHELHHAWPVWEIASLVIFASAVIHGVSATPLVRRFRDSRGPD